MYYYTNLFSCVLESSKPKTNRKLILKESINSNTKIHTLFSFSSYLSYHAEIFSYKTLETLSFINKITFYE